MRIQKDFIIQRRLHGISGDGIFHIVVPEVDVFVAEFLIQITAPVGALRIIHSITRIKQPMLLRRYDG